MLRNAGPREGDGPCRKCQAPAGWLRYVGGNNDPHRAHMNDDSWADDGCDRPAQPVRWDPDVRIAELEMALRPFAEKAAWIDSSRPDDLLLDYHCRVDDYRRAARALGMMKEKP